MTKVKLNLLTDTDMLLMVEKDIKRGICEIDVQKIITNTWKIVIKIKNLKHTYIHIMVISDLRHTECSNLPKARWA